MLESHKILGGELTLYTRRSSSIWQCGFYYKRIHTRTSTKTTDRKLADEFAKQWFYQKMAEIQSGVPVQSGKSRMFKLAAEKAISQYEADVAAGTRSASYIRGLKVLLPKLLEHVGAVKLQDAAKPAFWKDLKNSLAKTGIKPATIHQYKNLLRIILNEAHERGEIDSPPVFRRESLGKKEDTPRTHFSEAEYQMLLNELRNRHFALMGSELEEKAAELSDWVQFAANSGMRIGEQANVRFCDVECLEEKDTESGCPGNILIIRNIRGKRTKSGVCKTYFSAFKAFEGCMQRNGLSLENYKSSREKLFRYYARDLFRKVLEAANLRFTQDDPPLKRDLMSLRHTYICFGLQRGVPVFEIARNCRTSVQMIEKHYGKYLSIVGSTSINRDFREDNKPYQGAMSRAFITSRRRLI